MFKENIKYCTSPWGFREYKFEDYCRACQRMGLRYVSATINPNVPLGFSPTMGQSEAEHILEVAANNGVKIVEIEGGANYAKKEKVKESIEITKGHIDIAANLQVEYFRLFAGSIDEDKITDDTYQQISMALTELGNYAEQYGIKIAMENHGGLTRTAEQVLKILDRVEASSVGLNYDGANFLAGGEDPQRAFNMLSPHIIFTHFKNCKNQEGRLKYCRMREGVIDYRPIVKKLLGTYSGYYTIEYEEPSDVEKGTEEEYIYLQKLIKGISLNNPT